MAPLFEGIDEPVEVDAVSGACLMVKRSVFERIGMFSSDYFMYSEEIDLCFKMQATGWKTYFIPTAIVIHFGGASSSQSSVNAFSSVMMLESRWRFFRKTRSVWYCGLYRLAIFIAGVIRIALVLLMWPVYRLLGKRSSLMIVLKKWTARLRWTLGGESWVKKYGS
jgi:GT2 family glycosyltransferase